MVDVKICGVCRPEDARTASDAGAAWVGVILAPDRTRTRTITEAAAIFASSTARRVGVFVDPPVDRVIDAVRDLALDAVQLHGDESIAQVRRIRDGVACEIWKAIRVKRGADLTRGAGMYRGSVHAILLDGWSADAHGGTGVRFDWEAVVEAGMPEAPVAMRLIVAGGLTPRNVAAAVALLHPAMVDVSSGVEAAPGRKSPEMIRAFVAAARGNGDRQ
jgi:phosphoribosylanthranilate isomerase